LCRKEKHTYWPRKRESGRRRKTARNLDDLFYHLLLLLVNHVFDFGLKNKMQIKITWSRREMENREA